MNKETKQICLFDAPMEMLKFKFSMEICITVFIELVGSSIFKDILRCILPMIISFSADHQ